MTDHKFKLLIAGEVKTGKTSLLLNDQVTTQTRYVPTTGIDFCFRTVCVEDKVVRLELWDTSGDDKFRSLISSYCRGIQAVIIVYDVTRPETFAKVLQWLKFVQKHCFSGVPVFLVGNKTDLSEVRKVTQSEGEGLAKEHGLDYFETSATDMKHVNSVLRSITQFLLSHPSPDGELPGRRACMAARPVKQKSSACTLL